MFLSIFSGQAALMNGEIEETIVHWSADVSTVTVHLSYFHFYFASNILLSAITITNVAAVVYRGLDQRRLF